jgi:hypothetical protein
MTAGILSILEPCTSRRKSKVQKIRNSSWMSYYILSIVRLIPMIEYPDHLSAFFLCLSLQFRHVNSGCSVLYLTSTICETNIIIIGKPALLEPQPSLEDSARIHAIYTSSDFTTVLISMWNILQTGLHSSKFNSHYRTECERFQVWRILGTC